VKRWDSARLGIGLRVATILLVAGAAVWRGTFAAHQLIPQGTMMRCWAQVRDCK